MLCEYVHGYYERRCICEYWQIELGNSFLAC